MGLSPAFGIAAHAGEPNTDLQGRVVAVPDGDTVMMLDAANTQHKVRLACIDAPEKRQDFGTQSGAALGPRWPKRPVAFRAHTDGSTAAAALELAVSHRMRRGYVVADN